MKVVTVIGDSPSLFPSGLSARRRSAPYFRASRVGTTAALRGCCRKAHTIKLCQVYRAVLSIQCFDAGRSRAIYQASVLGGEQRSSRNGADLSIEFAPGEWLI